MKIVEPGAVAPQGREPRQRELYLRLFPKRLAQLLASLTPAHLAAYLRVLMHYVQAGGVLADDEKLATISGLASRRWAELRADLLTLGIATTSDGFWHDLDQDESIRRQLDHSEAQRERALKRRYAAKG